LAGVLPVLAAALTIARRPDAAAELARRGCRTLEQGDLDRAGTELAARRW